MENEINEVLEEIYETLERSLPRKNAQVFRSVDRSRLAIADILAKYTSSDGTIPRSKINAVLRDIRAMEGAAYRDLRTELDSVLSTTAQDTTVTLAEAIVAIIGVALLIETLGLPVALADLPVGVAEAIFSAMTGSTYAEHTTKATRSAFNRRDGDEKVLIDRLRKVITDLRKDVEVTLRENIRKGEGTTTILRNIDRNFSEFKWRLDTIVETEAMYVMRQAVADYADKSGLVKALKIVDFPHGDPKEHKRHKCYVYAHQDEHGLGTGVYPIGTRKIRNPHPRCRSALFFVLIDELN